MSTPPPLPPRRRTPKPQPKQSLPEHRSFFGRFTNPLLLWEVLRAGRRTGQLALARTVLGGILLFAMWLLWSARFSTTNSFTGSATQIGKELSRFAENFAITFFFVQTVTVFLLTPVFVSAAIFEERETRSGEILLTTRLTRREVYIGKVGARIVQVLLVILAGLPILFLTQLWGGVSEGIIIVCYLAICLSTISVGTLTAAVSAYTETMRGAILRTYLMVFIFEVLIFPASPMLIILLSAGHWIAGAVGFGWYLPMQIAIIGISYSIGQRWLRMAMLRQKKRLDEADEARPQFTSQQPIRLLGVTDSDSPLLWKELETTNRVQLQQFFRQFFSNQPWNERHSFESMGFYRYFMLSPRIEAAFIRTVSLIVLIILGVCVVLNLIPPTGTLRYIGGTILLWMMLSVGLSAAGSIAKERQKQTLIDLFMLPGPRRELLVAKWVGAMAYAEIPLLLLAILIVIVCLGSGITVFAVVPMLLSLLAFSCFCTSFGLWLSTLCHKVVQANIWFLSLFLGVILGLLLLAEGTQQIVFLEDGSVTSDYVAWFRMLNPILAWNRLLLTHTPTGYGWVSSDTMIPFDRDVYLITLGSIVIYSVGAWVFWRLAIRRFEREGQE